MHTSSLERKTLAIGRVLHIRMMELTQRARVLASSLPPDHHMQPELERLATDIEEAKFDLANLITGAVLEAQVLRMRGVGDE